jgi:hypothetical protein
MTRAKRLLLAVMAITFKVLKKRRCRKTVTYGWSKFPMLRLRGIGDPPRSTVTKSGGARPDLTRGDITTPESSMLGAVDDMYGPSPARDVKDADEKGFLLIVSDATHVDQLLVAPFCDTASNERCRSTISLLIVWRPFAVAAKSPHRSAQPDRTAMRFARHICVLFAKNAAKNKANDTGYS